MADDERNPEVAAWLEVEPLDDVTRRRLVSTALRETGTAPTPARPSRPWRWVAVAAAVLVVLVVGLALLRADGGNDTTTASRGEPTALDPESFAEQLSVAPDVGDYGDLDRSANLDALRHALAEPASDAQSAPAVPKAQADTAGSATERAPASCAIGATGTIVAQGRGTIEGRPVTVVLLEGPDGTRSLEAFFDDSCELRHLGGR